MSQAIATDAVLKDALEYAERGWKVVPVRHRSKAPLLNDWPKQASDDASVVAEWYDRWPDANVGIALGRPSGIVDIEFDGEEGKKTAARVFRDTFTPTFTSGKSTHRLFKWRDDLPEKAKIVVEGLEVRSTGGQTVFPPSIHPSGAAYAWTPGLGTDDVEIQEIPDEVLAWIWNHDAHAPKAGERKDSIHWDNVFRGMSPGERTDGLTSIIGKMLRSQADLNDETALYVAYHSVLAINDRNTPPLDHDKVCETFRSILRREQGRRAAESVEAIINPSVDEAVNRASGSDDKAAPREWALVRVEADPPVFELYGPQFRETENRCIRLTAEQICSPQAIRVEAVKQANVALPAAFTKAWNGTGRRGPNGEIDEGLFSRLFRASQRRAASPEERRDATVAGRLLEWLEKAQYLEEGEKPSPRRASKERDGSIMFIFNRALSDLSITADKISRRDLTAILRRCEAKCRRTDLYRFQLLTPDGLKTLRKIAETGEEVTSGE